MKNIAIIAFLFVALVSCSGAKGNPDAKYACPMHPEITSDTMVKCPVYGMDLER